MKIRNRITITFTILTVSIVLITYIIVYTFSYNERIDFFNKQLKQRASIAEKLFLESSTIDERLKQKLKESFSHRLPYELELVSNFNAINDSLTNSKWSFIPTNIINELKLTEFKLFSSNSYKGVARLYNINDQQYLVLVVAKDIYGATYLNKLKGWMISTTIISILLSIIISRLLAAKILKPIAVKVKKANQISASNLSERLNVYNENDEVGMLAIAFNNMLDRLEKSFELQQNFVRYASHELKNPLAVIMGESELLLTKERSINEYISTTTTINKQAEKLNNLVNQFLSLSRVKPDNILKKEIEIDEIMIELISHYKQNNPGLIINLHFGKSLRQNNWTILGNYDLLKTAFQNILENAIKFSNSKPIAINVQFKNKQILISIKDEGLGINIDEAKIVFEPLYRSKNTQHIEGSGLGLSIVKNIIDQHLGKVYINTENKNGTEVVVVLNPN